MFKKNVRGYNHILKMIQQKNENDLNDSGHMKVLTIVGTRPELIKLSAVIKKLDLFCHHILAHTGQNFDFELNQVFFDDLEIRKPDYFLNCADENFAYTIANTIKSTFDLIQKENPDAVLIYGDTNSCLSVIVAKRLKVPIFHMEAGNRCFDQRVPEEINRKIVDHLSDINLPISEHARKYLEKEGIASNMIIKIGSSMSEVLNNQKEKISRSDILNLLDLKVSEYFVVSLHREENVDRIDNLIKVIDILNEISERYNKKVVFSIHPRTQKRIDENGLADRFNKNIIKLKPLGFNDYIKLQMNSYCTLSDSGTISEESSILGFSAITIRETHERPEAMDEGTVIMTGLDKTNVINSINVVKSSKVSRITQDYDVDNVSDKVVRIIHSYTHYVNQFVWRK